MRSRSPRTVILVLSALLFSSLHSLAPADALVLREIPAGWENIYAAPAQLHSAKLVAAAQGHAKSATSQSTINITYTDVPDAEKIPIQAALDIWSQNWQSTVPVNVSARYISEGTGGILASASPVNFFQGFKGAPDPTIWYPSAMANAIAGKDLDPENPEIKININSAMASAFYLGTDGNCPLNQYDLESIIIHEMTHGLGFLSNDSYDSYFGYGTIDQPTPFDAFAQTPDGSRLMDLPSPSIVLGNALINTLVWSGVNGIAANNGVPPLLFTPNPYQPGSSVSHLDEATFQGSGPNALMTPSWPAGAVFREPGDLALAMLKDMRGKPPAGKPAGIPDAPQSVTAIVGDKSAIVNFRPPDNARTSVVSKYTVVVDQTGAVITGTSSPIAIPHLTNGSQYSFSVTASNSLGTSPAVKSNVVVPVGQWSSTTIDPLADAQHIATTIFRGQPAIAYTSSKTGTLKLALWNAKKWVISTIDGNSTVGGATRDNVAGSVSLCTSTPGKNQRLDVVYADLTNKTLRYAGYNGTSWKYSVVDGNASAINTYTDPNRVRTSSDVSGANACVDTPDGLQIFYRDQSQGIILGALALPNTIATQPVWSYELVDGDRATNGRTTGDVGFHMSALNIGHNVYLLYDSIQQVNQQKQAIAGEVRLATRASAYPEDWQYQSLDSVSGPVAVAGYDVSLTNLGGDIKAAWFAANTLSLPNPSALRYMDITHNSTVSQADTSTYGIPQAPINISNQDILFNCQDRLCAFNNSSQSTQLVTTSDISNSANVYWITINKLKYALVGVGGALKLFYPLKAF